MKKYGALLAIALSASVVQAQTHKPLTYSAVSYPVVANPEPATVDAATANSGVFPIRHAPAKRYTENTAPVYQLGENTADTFVTMQYPIPPKSKPIGHATRHLLKYQADTTRQANSIPMLGSTAQKSMDRYQKSFTTSLPEWFEEHLSDKAK